MFEQSPDTSMAYRASILRQLEEREREQRRMQIIFQHFSSLVDQLNRKNRNLFNDGGTLTSAEEVEKLKNKLSHTSEVLSKKDEDLIVSRKNLSEAKSKLTAIELQKERLLLEVEKLKFENDKMQFSLLELENQIIANNKERPVLLESLEESTNNAKNLTHEQYKLIENISKMQEPRINALNAEIALAEERKHLKIQEEIAKAVQDVTYDDKASTVMEFSPETSEDFIMTEVIPKKMKFKVAAHDSEVNDIEWFTDDTFATCSSDRKLKIWRTSEENNGAFKTATLIGCNGSINRIDFNSDRNVCLAASSDKTCRIWNISSQRMLTTFSGHSEKLSSAKFHRDHCVVSGSHDRTIKIWDLISDKCVKTYFYSTVFDVASKCGPTQNGIASAHYDKKVRLWDEKQNEPIKEIILDQKCCSLDVSLDGFQLLVSSRDDILRTFDIRNYKQIHSYASEFYRTSTDISKVIFSPTAQYIAAGSANGNIYVWNTNSTKLEKVLRTTTESSAVLSLSWNQSGRGILSCDKMKTCSLWK